MVLLTFSLIVVIYISICISLSSKLNYLVDLSYQTHGQIPEELKSVISEEKFYLLDYRRSCPKGRGKITEEYSYTFPITFLWGNKAYSEYYFTYKKFDEYEGLVAGGCNVRIKVNWEFKDGKWEIIGVFEQP